MNTGFSFVLPSTLPHPKHLMRKGTESDGERRPEEYKDQEAGETGIHLEFIVLDLQVYVTEITDFITVGKSNVWVNKALLVFSVLWCSKL